LPGVKEIGDRAAAEHTEADQMEKCPTYTLDTYVAGALSLVHAGAVVLAALFIVGGFVARLFSSTGSIVLFSLALLILAVQVVSRVRHIRKLDRTRYVDGRVEFWSGGAEAWVSEDRARRIAKREFTCADQWRPISLGYPGIEVQLSGVEEPVEQLYPPGQEELRDRMFEYLSRRHPGIATSATAIDE
jgi:hypothetical protein